MPRVSFATYYERRIKLTEAWKARRGDFSRLPPTEQWALHDYYRFAESLSEQQVREQWTTQQAKHSSLPQRAGRAYAAFESMLTIVVTPHTKGKRHKLGKVKVESLVLPQPNTRKIAQTLLEVVRGGVRSTIKENDEKEQNTYQHETSL